MNTPCNRILTDIETKVDVLSCCSCLLSLNALGLSLAVDVCRTTKYFELLLADWQKCMPLGEACDVDFAMWGKEKLSEMMSKVRNAYGIQNVTVSQQIYASEDCLRFIETQQKVDIFDSSLEVLHQVDGDDVPIILMYSLRALSAVSLKIAEFLNSPTAELIAMSYEQWAANYKMHYQKNCHSEYKKWKLQFTQRTLQRHLQKRLKTEADSFKQMFMESDDDFDLIYDDDKQQIDIDGLSRYLFTHVERFGVSYIDSKPWFSQELKALFDFVETWNLIQADLQPAEKERKTQTTKPEKTEDVEIVAKLKPMFFNDEKNVKEFLKNIRGTKPSFITSLVNEWVKEGRISSYCDTRKGDLWKVLNDAGLYTKTKQNWCKQVH